jgi:adenine-specific DNA-methyltransferase
MAEKKRITNRNKAKEPVKNTAKKFANSAGARKKGISGNAPVSVAREEEDTFKELVHVLGQDSAGRFLSHDGELLRTVVSECARKQDEVLLALLYSSPLLRRRFFKTAHLNLRTSDVPRSKLLTSDVRSLKGGEGGVPVCDVEALVHFVESKALLAESYTAFKNIIGLSDGGAYVRERGEVVLNWPYKDCMLEGGQTKEDARRNEVFWNEALAPDAIARLLEPKVLTNWQRVTGKGAKQATSIALREDGTLDENLLLKGNNLLALHSLFPRYAGKVKLIYIDPPYNTGGASETFSYNNTFNHSSWLTFMKNRLEVAKEMLREDGFIAVTIDHAELFYLGVLADEIFGKENRVGIVTIYINPKGRQHERFFSASTEYMLVYAKNEKMAVFNKTTLDPEKEKTFTYQDLQGRYRLENFIRARSNTLRTEKPDFWYPIYVKNDMSVVSHKKTSGFFEVWPIKNGKEYTWKTKKDTFIERNKGGYFVAERENDSITILHKYHEQQVFKNIWTDKKYFAEFFGTNVLKKCIGKNAFSYPKSLYAVLDTAKIMTQKDDIILDFFGGSGTTGHAILELNKMDKGNRKFILVEQLEEHVDIIKKRLQENLKEYSGDMLTAELFPLAHTYATRIKHAKDTDELLSLWSEVEARGFVQPLFPPGALGEHERDFRALSLTEQQRLALEQIAPHQLFLNYAEIDDADWKVSKKDKEMNKQFYT